MLDFYCLLAEVELLRIGVKKQQECAEYLVVWKKCRNFAAQ